MFDKDRDRPLETCFGRIVQRRRPAAIVVVTGEAPIVHACAVTKERGDIFGIVVASLISRA